VAWLLPIFNRGTMTQITAYEGWAMLEVMGHRKRVGRVQEVEMYGGKMLRIDIPLEGGDVTEFYSCASIYALRPLSEEVARDAAKRHADPRPVRPVDYRALPAPKPKGYDSHDDDQADRDEELPL
jgi:hypothetical protein